MQRCKHCGSSPEGSLLLCLCVHVRVCVCGCTMCISLCLKRQPWQFAVAASLFKERSLNSKSPLTLTLTGGFFQLFRVPAGSTQPRAGGKSVRRRRCQWWRGAEVFAFTPLTFRFTFPNKCTTLMRNAERQKRIHINIIYFSCILSSSIQYLPHS